MINNEILSFVKDQLAQGTTKDQVKDILVTQGGWDDKDVEEAFETINFSGTSYPEILKNAVADVTKTEEKTAVSAGVPAVATVRPSAFAPASELMNAVSKNPDPQIFSPGLSHREQPKSMEPSTSGSFTHSEFSPRFPMTAPPAQSAERVLPRTNIAGGPNALSGLRERIASGFSTTPSSVEKPDIVSEPIVTKAQTVFSSPKVSVAESNNFPAMTSLTAPKPEIANNIQPTERGGLSSLPVLNKIAAPSLASAPIPSIQPAHPVAIFPKNSTGGGVGNLRLSPTPAQIAALQGQKRGRFLLGFLMFLIGLFVGGISMNAYMNGYINTSALNGMIEKGMDMIGLGTVTSPSPKDSPEPAKTPADPDVNGGS